MNKRINTKLHKNARGFSSCVFFRMRKFLSIFLCLVLAVSLSGCGEKKTCQNILNDFIATIKTGELEKAAAFVGMGAAEFNALVQTVNNSDTYGSNRVEYIKKITSKLDYKVLEYKMIGDSNVRLTVKFTNIDLTDTYANVVSEISSYMGTHTSDTAEKFRGAVQDIISTKMTKYEEQEPNFEKTIQIFFLKNDKVWQLNLSNPDANSGLFDCITGGGGDFLAGLKTLSSAAAISIDAKLFNQSTNSIKYNLKNFSMISTNSSFADIKKMFLLESDLVDNVINTITLENGDQIKITTKNGKTIAKEYLYETHKSELVDYNLNKAKIEDIKNYALSLDKGTTSYDTFASKIGSTGYLVNENFEDGRKTYIFVGGQDILITGIFTNENMLLDFNIQG